MASFQNVLVKISKDLCVGICLLTTRKSDKMSLVFLYIHMYSVMQTVLSLVALHSYEVTHMYI